MKNKNLALMSTGRPEACMQIRKETQTPVGKEEPARKKGDQEETRSIQEHRETGSANEDRQEMVSPKEEHRETGCKGEAELEPQIDYRIQGIPHETMELKGEEVEDENLFVI